MDKSQDGYITYDDMHDILQDMGKNDNEIKEIFQSSSYTQDDKIKYSDFISIFLKQFRP